MWRVGYLGPMQRPRHALMKFLLVQSVSPPPPTPILGSVGGRFLTRLQTYRIKTRRAVSVCHPSFSTNKTFSYTSNQNPIQLFKRNFASHPYIFSMKMYLVRCRTIFVGWQVVSAPAWCQVGMLVKHPGGRGGGIFLLKTKVQSQLGFTTL